MRRISPGRVPKGLPHVHDRQSDSFALLRPQPRKEEIQTRLRTVFPAKPDGPAPHQIAHHNAVIVTFANRNLVDSNHLRPRGPNPPELLPHILLLQGLDRLPIQVQFLGHILKGRTSATTAHIKGKSFRIKGSFRQPFQAFRLHHMANSARHAPDFHIQVDAHVPTGKVPNPTDFPVVKNFVNTAADAANSFFPLRLSRITRPLGSPKMPDTVC